MVKNTYKVNAKLWKKFKTDKSKALFNAMMKQMLPNQALTIHPKTPKIPKGQWSTICFNAGCYAAWALEGDPLCKGDIVETINPNTGKSLRKTTAK